MRSATDQFPAIRTTADAIEWASQQLDRVPYAVSLLFPCGLRSPPCFGIRR